jgi:hypothetical protein
MNNTEVKNKKLKFLCDQSMVNSINGAFQHAGVYLNGLSEADPNKKKVRELLLNIILNFTEQYRNDVTDSQHCSNIEELANTMSSEFKDKGVLRNDRFRVGISQKALNLYLKYLWCLDEIPTPPHCPIDRRIIEKLGIQYQQRGQYDWTKLDCIQKYGELIFLCKKKAEGIPIAEWELKIWEF